MESKAVSQAIILSIESTPRALHLKEEVKCHLCDFTAVWRPLLKAHKIKVHCSNQGDAGIQIRP